MDITLPKIPSQSKCVNKKNNKKIKKSIGSKIKKACRECLRVSVGIVQYLCLYKRERKCLRLCWCVCVCVSVLVCVCVCVSVCVCVNTNKQLARRQPARAFRPPVRWSQSPVVLRRDVGGWSERTLCKHSPREWQTQGQSWAQPERVADSGAESGTARESGRLRSRAGPGTALIRPRSG